MAKKKRKAAKKTTPKKRRRNPAQKIAKKKVVKRRVRRNPRPAAMTARIGYLMPEALSVVAGFMGSRALVNSFLTSYSGYIRGGAQMLTGIGAGIVVEMLFGKNKAKSKALSDGLAVGGMVSGAITLFDTATNQSYKNLYMADDITYLKRNKRRLTGRNTGQYVKMLPQFSTANAGMGEYVTAGSGYMKNRTYM